MHLSRALVSSFLFVSAVLAAQEGDWAGIVRGTNSRKLTAVRGTFTVPELQGTIGSGIVIGVGLDGSIWCKTGSLAAGIIMKKTQDGFDAQAWVEFWPKVNDYDANPQLIIISPRDKIKVTIRRLGGSPLKGRFEMENLNTRATWSGVLESPKENPLCGESAYWVVGVIADGGITPLANFGKVVFSEIMYQLEGYTERELIDPFSVQKIHILKNTIPITSVTLDGRPVDVTVTYGTRG